MRVTDNRSNGGIAQTSVDFLIGFSIFAITLLFVLQLATGSIISLSPESPTKDAMSERAGEFLYQNYDDFADADQDLLDQNHSDVMDDLEVPEEEFNVNVTITDTEGDCVTTIDNCTTGSPGAMPDRMTSDISGERRVARIDGNTTVIDVRVWDDPTEVGGG